ncbi:DUF6694 family lipoprotein [Thalassotalea sp. ND16A]|uniref:DUF6694 family lipoprotein n=1 Tax=Thalassotalea sp. ND16A TaxID=1535422 RepID=UPI00051A7053|nr:DUF6694 family lipoprotein [Thalassotalea sp. ND16A]KGK01569.1 hypothetical protein ND16A_2971 [Thalassotalea sp. ND16A]
MRLIKIFLLVLMFSGCASTTPDYVFDGSSAESTQQGVNYLSSQLSSTEQKKFLSALFQIHFYDTLTSTEALNNPELNKPLNFEVIGKKIDGMTYKEVLVFAKTSPTKVSVSSE